MFLELSMFVLSFLGYAMHMYKVFFQPSLFLGASNDTRLFWCYVLRAHFCWAWVWPNVILYSTCAWDEIRLIDPVLCPKVLMKCNCHLRLLCPDRSQAGHRKMLRAMCRHSLCTAIYVEVSLVTWYVGL
jgi:hypothetical protein